MIRIPRICLFVVLVCIDRVIKIVVIVIRKVSVRVWRLALHYQFRIIAPKQNTAFITHPGISADTLIPCDESVVTAGQPVPRIPRGSKSAAGWALIVLITPGTVDARKS